MAPDRDDPLTPEQIELLAERAVGEYALRIEDGEDLDAETFAADQPEAIREAVLRLCRQWARARPLLRPERPAAEGDRRLGPFELLGRLGAGGMAEVFRARDTRDDRVVALKVLHAHLAGSAEVVERFRRETHAIQKVPHPHVVRIHETGEADGRPYLVMDLAQGSLAARLQEGPLSVPEASRIVASIAEGLAFVHDHDIIHRDVKPQNILLFEDGTARLADFGIALMEQRRLTRTGQLFGTPAYMSPEQALAQRVRIDHRTDVFSLGVVLYECLARVLPFDGPTEQEILHKLSFDKPEPLRTRRPELPRDLERVCDKALEKSPQDRYASADEMAADLRRLLAHEPVRARPPGLARRAARWFQSRRTVVLAVLLGMVAVVGALTTSDWLRGTDRRGQLADEARQLLDDLPWDRLERGQGLGSSRADCQRLADLHAELEAERPRLDADQLAVLERTGARLDVLLEVLLATGDAALGTARNPGSHQERVAALLQAQDVFAQAARLAPDDRRVAALESDAALEPRVSVTALDRAGRPTTAAVRARRVDEVTGLAGASTEVGEAPLVDVLVAPGRWRFAVVFDDGAFVEFTRHLEPAGRFELTARQPDVDATLERMARIEGATFVHAGRPAVAHPMAGVPVTLEPFFLDEREVSNGEWRAFVEATGRPVPELWQSLPLVEIPDDWDDLPVCDVTVGEMRAYAEWRGKRLPTRLEWMLAARGEEGRLTPWEDETLAVADGANLRGGTYKNWDDRPETRLQDYLVKVEPVDGRPDARSPEGLHHLLGNVAELTSTFFVQQQDGVWVADPERRDVVGSWWSRSPDDYDLRDTTFTYTVVQGAGTWLGFRCARSARP